MQIIEEDKLRFTFPDNWHVCKYDDHLFYRKGLVRAIEGLKALDIVARYMQSNEDYLLLIEIKDFRNHAAENRKRQTNGHLVQEVIEKAVHSIAGLYIGCYNKQAKHLDLLNFTNGFPERIKLILFMEDDPLLGKSMISKENQKKTRDNLYLDLNSKIRKRLSIIPEILSIETVTPRHVFAVTSL